MKKDKNFIDEISHKFNFEEFEFYLEYPHEIYWDETDNDSTYRKVLKNIASNGKSNPKCLYVHIPFCPRQCFYCVCTTFVTNDYQKVQKYMDVLYREIELLSDFFDKNSIDPDFAEIHLGGGSPTCLHKKEFDTLIEKIGSLTGKREDRFFSIEIDPRFSKMEDLEYYRSKGINRISFGIQDFNIDVQKAVNRIQPQSLMESLLTDDTRDMFTGVNMDIICGLPKQTRKTFEDTMGRVVDFAPDRVCLYPLNNISQFLQHQKLMEKHGLPDLEEKTGLFETGVKALTNNGYKRIGFDHFARSDDALAKAWNRGRLDWNRLGYRPGTFHDVIGVGMSSAARISENYYFLCTYSLSEYETSVMNGAFPISRKYKLTGDDLIRREIVQDFRTWFTIDRFQIEEKYKISFSEYFKEEEIILDEFRKREIIDDRDNTITVTNPDNFSVFFVCKVFDKYVRN